MTACLGTNLCEIATGTVTLQDGETVCNACPEWARECLARRVLAMDLHQRRQWLAKFEAMHGVDVADQLRAEIKAEWEARRAVA